MRGKAGLPLVLWPWRLLTSFVHLTSTAAMLPLTLAASLLHVAVVFTMLTYTLLNHAIRPAGFFWVSSLAVDGCLQGKRFHGVEDNNNLQKRPQICLPQQLLHVGKCVLSVPLCVLATIWSVSRQGASTATNLAFYYPIVVPVRAVASTTEKAVTRLAGYLWGSAPEQQLVVREARPEEMESVTKMLEHDRARLLLPTQLHVLSMPGSFAAMFVIGGVVNCLLQSELVAILAAFPIWVGVIQANLSCYWAQEQERRINEGRLSRHLVAVYKNRVQGVVRIVSYQDQEHIPVIKEIVWVENDRFDVPGELLNSAEAYAKGEIHATLCELEMRKLGMLTAHGFHLTEKWDALSIFPGIELENYELSKTAKG
ncbi:uncharacterized protein [Branchiostoma lanceolatum]|uniref:uncharacterized protein n=1 Tax=Branchiostoma lanceolatum TaxID=7740 RepID=UPI00345719FD